ncbi:MAG: quinolinate synthase NadA [Candidatus Undinarchaeales archaeon]|jgi:quinolinate synthase|nr:quinolinate synthase NadA [Candidatus Undinarchaeales archaeon]MDP7493029.1 quinolinate synthase NadA [Candidatus Undinarchaeales archaeon]
MSKTVTTDVELVDSINLLKKEKDAIILVHNYQPIEIYQVSDHIGDSLELCRLAQRTKAETIVFCGVDFMAESAAVLNPELTVLIPERHARCPMAAMATVPQVHRMRSLHSDAAVVAYVNTSAAVKAASDICCTSANAVRVVDSLDEEEAILLPDCNLAVYTATKSSKRIIPWPGHCYVHNRILEDEVRKAKSLHPDASVLVHPECPPAVWSLANSVESTSGMLRFVRESDASEFIIVTERGMVNRLQLEEPNRRYYAVGGICAQMKQNSLKKVYDALTSMQNRVIVPEDVADGARMALERMLQVG